LTNAEKKRRWREKNPEKHKLELEQRCKNRKAKNAAIPSEELRRKECERKAKWRANISRQKKVSIRAKNTQYQNEKREGVRDAKVTAEVCASGNSSTDRMRKLRSQEKVKFKWNSSTSPIVASKLAALKKSRTKEANLSRRSLLNLYNELPSSRNKRSFEDRFSSTRKTLKKSQGDLLDLTCHTKHKSRGKKASVSENTKCQVREFYNSDTVSRVLPHTKSTIKIDGDRVPVRYMEINLNQAFLQFRIKNQCQVARETFRKLRPRNVKLKKAATRALCCCTIHQNIEYLRTKIYVMLKINKMPSDAFKDNESLLDLALCNKDSVPCTLRKCDSCKEFPKLDFLSTIKCSAKCMQDDIDCDAKGHQIMLRQFKRMPYQYRGEWKKKTKLVDESLTPSQLPNLLKCQLADFPRHRLNVSHTGKLWDDIEINLGDASIVKIQDFSENYTHLLPDEIYEIHWCQDECTVYPVVVLRKVDGVLREDHFCIFSADLKHDAAFVEAANTKIHEYYQQNGVNIELDIEMNDGCASQYKCITAFRNLSLRKIQTLRIYFETAHGKSKSDGLGGTVKSFVARDIAAKRVVIRTPQELLAYCQEHLRKFNSQDGKLLNREFMLLEEEEVSRMREMLSKKATYQTIKGTRNIHMVSNKVSCGAGIYAREFACLCSNCIKGGQFI
jgi:hypothetical protein